MKKVSITKEKIYIAGIPAIIWGAPSEKAYIHVHGKCSRKEYAEGFAEIAEAKGFQTVSFDLPKHGERENESCPCDIWSSMRDLRTIYDFAAERWSEISLFGCSIGAFFSLNTYSALPIKKALFQSPIVDMDLLIHNMFGRFGVTEEQLCEKGEIPTPIETLSWKYYTYVKEHPIEKWDIPTAVLYGGLDNLQSIDAIRAFCDKFGAALTVSEKSEHPFMAESDASIVEGWLSENI